MSGEPIVCLLGTPRLARADGSMHALERKDAALLALLALDGAAPRARLAALLWPDVEAGTARANLRQRLFRLRGVAGHDVVEPGATLRLTEYCRLDLAALPRALADDAAAGTGELLAGHDYDDHDELSHWVHAARARWRARRLDLLAQRASELEAARRIAAALPYAERLLADEPLLEHAHRRVMRLHYLRGDRAAALAAYERCRDVLGRELGLRPGAETLELARLVESSGGPAAPPLPAPPRPPAALRPPRLVGRDAEWQRLQALRSDAGAMLLIGDAGIGKSRLLGDFIAARGEQAALLCGARPGDAQLPYALAARLVGLLAQRYGRPREAACAELAHIAAEFGAPPPGRLEALRLRQALVAALDDWRGAGLAWLALDDLHFADEATLGLLPALVDRLREGGVACLLASRASELPAAVRGWLDGADGNVVALPLAPLDASGVAALLDSLGLAGLDPARWAAPLQRHTGGNPLFVLETLLALIERDAQALAAAPRELPVPGAVGELIERRLHALSPSALKLARLAAVATPDFGVELAAAVLGQHALDIADGWRELEAALVVRDDGFAHDLIREAALRTVPAPIARALHGAVAAQLALRDAPAARVAAHREAAGDVAAAARDYEAAAAQARQRSAPREELQALDAAVRCHRAAGTPAGDAHAFDAEWRSVHLLLGLESNDAALARAEALLARAAGPRQRAAAREAEARVRNERYEPEAALAAARESEALAAEAGDEALALLAAQRAGSALMRLGQPGAAAEAQQAHLDRIGVLPADERLYWLAEYGTALDYADRRRDAVAVFERTIAEAEAHGRWDAASEAYCNLGIALMYLGRADAALRASQCGVECGERAGASPASLLLDRMNFAGALRDAGRFTEYLALAEPLPQALRDAGHAVWALNAENDLAICFDWLGRPELAQRVLNPPPDDTPALLRAARLFVRARLLRGKPAVPGQPTPAQLVREANGLIDAAGAVGRTYVRLVIALELARDAEPAEAIAQTAAIEAQAERCEQYTLARNALTVRTDVLLKGDDVAAAAAAGRRLLEHCLRDGPQPSVYPPLPWWLAHRALQRAGEHADAALARQRACAWIDEVALPQLPAAFHRSFVERNPINVALRRGS